MSAFVNRGRRTADGYVCALLTVLWLFLPYGGYARMMEGKYVCYLLLTLGALGIMTDAAARGRLYDADRMTPAKWFAAAYLGFSALSAVLSPYGAHTLLGGTRRDGLLTLTLYVLSFFLLSLFLRVHRRLLFLTMVSALICDLLTLLQLAGWNPLGLYPQGLGYYDGDAAYPGFYAGVSGNIDFTAFLLALAVCVLAAAVVRLRLWQAVPVLVLTLWTLYRLGVAAAWAGIGFAAVWGLALLFPRYRGRMLCLSALLSAGALLFLYFFDGESGTLAEAARLLHGEADGAFGSGRLAIWRDCLHLAAQRPLLGGGPDTLWLRGVEPFAWLHGGEVVPADITAAHNEYLNILVNQGAPALLAYLGLLAVSLARCFRRAQRTRYAVCGMGLLCYVAMALFSISTCITAPYVWLLLVLCNLDDSD